MKKKNLENNAFNSDKLIPWYFVMFFVFIAVVDGIMVTLAVKTHTGTVTDHPYEKGLAYNKIISAANNQGNLGWNSEIIYNNGIIEFKLHDTSGKIIVADNIEAKITRPTHSGLDFSTDLTSGMAQVDFPEKGLWEVRIFAKIGEEEYQTSKKIIVK